MNIKFLPKISILGAGNIGVSCARRIIEKGYADVVLYDRTDGIAQGRALDIAESAPILGFDSKITGTSDLNETAGSDITVITAGSRVIPKSRSELLYLNLEIIVDLTRAVKATSPQSIIIVVTNPVDAMTYLALQISRFSRNKVLGLSGALDTSRFAYFIANELNVSVNDVIACVLGQHGESMVVVPRLSMVKGVPLTEILPPEAINRLVQRTINAGSEIINLLNRTGRASYATSAAISQMVEAIILDKKVVIPCSIALQGEYGIKDLAIGVPVQLGIQGAEQIIELPLNDEEKARFENSVESVRQQVQSMREKIAETG